MALQTCKDVVQREGPKAKPGRTKSLGVPNKLERKAIKRENPGDL